jgi:hypothetical protein
MSISLRIDDEIVASALLEWLILPEISAAPRWPKLRENCRIRSILCNLMWDPWPWRSRIEDRRVSSRIKGCKSAKNVAHDGLMIAR